MQSPARVIRNNTKSRTYLYLIWIVLALNIRYSFIPSLVTPLQTPIWDSGIGYILTPFSLYTYLILARTTWSLSNTMLGSVEQASRSSLLTIFAALVILLGFLSLADIAIAYVTGNDLFLLQVIYNLVCSPPSVDDVVMYGVTGSGDVINQTVNQSVI